MDENVLGTNICPKNFDTARRMHGRHFARYMLAAGHARGLRVLDAACGSGFGTAYIATVAESVLGLDLDKDLIDWSRKHFMGPNVRFEPHDLHEPINTSTPFDLVISFETLEHVRDPDLCLANFIDVLSEMGTAIVSVPNGTKELRKRTAKPYHQRQFSAQDIDQLLRGWFEDVQFFSQLYRKGLGHYLQKLTGHRKHRAENYSFPPGLMDEAKTWVAICRRPKRRNL